MLDFFDYIISFLENIGNWFNNMLESLMQILSLLVNLPGVVTKIVGFVPPIIAVSCTIISAVAIAKLIVGWGNS